MGSFLEKFGSEVFTTKAAKEYLMQSEFAEYLQVIDGEKELCESLATSVANALMQWAVSKECLHYCHWFIPISDVSSEKYNTFLSIKNGEAYLKFSQEQLIKGETDASSVPNGGSRSTFEARGITIWDVTSPCFIKTAKSGFKVLCIPTSLTAFSGQSLDKKTPLLKAMKSLNANGKKVLKLLGIDAKKITVNAGAEQEYFLIKQSIFQKRLDLKTTGVTLFGSASAKGQENNDIYYSSPPEDVCAFFDALSKELWALGIPAATQHNEGAPRQHELACHYMPVNITVDQNILAMEVIKKVANEFGFVALFSEKPFKNFSGSGKHNNFSIGYIDKSGTEKNLFSLKKGITLPFAAFMVALISGVNKYSELVRLSCSYHNNDLRLGGNEAPPSIISIYLGDKLQGEIEAFLSGKATVIEARHFDEDRNRTSPLAFTQNKFEFRLVGAGASVATPNIFLITIISNELNELAKKLENKKENPLEILNKMFNVSRRIIFNGDNYSQGWQAEAKERGLPILKSVVDACECIIEDKAIKLFENTEVFSKDELFARHDIWLTNYSKTINIHSRVMLEMAKSDILPACLKYAEVISSSLDSVTRIDNREHMAQRKMLAKYQDLLDSLYANIDNLQSELAKANATIGKRQKAVYFKEKVLPFMDKLRSCVDELEKITDRSIWPYPTYSEILN